MIYARIVSPIDGRVGLRLVDPGNYVQTTNTNGLAVLTQLHPISVIFVRARGQYSGNHGRAARPERRSKSRHMTAPMSRPFRSGKSTTLDNQIDPTTGTVKLRANFDNLDDKLFPNQFVNARLLIKTLHGVVTVPSHAVQRGAPGTFVYLVGADDTVSVRTVDLGPLDGAMYAVNSGLSPGDRVVVDGADRLRDGAKILIHRGSLDPAASPRGQRMAKRPTKPGAQANTDRGAIRPAKPAMKMRM